MTQIVEEARARLYTNPRVLVLLLDALLVTLGFGIVAPSLSFYLIALEGGLTEPPGPGHTVPDTVVAEYSMIFGLMLASFMATRTLMARYFGDLSDHRGRKPLLIIGLFGYVLLLILFGLAQNWIHLLIIRLLQGVVSAMVWPVAEAALMDIVGPEKRGEGLGLYMMATNIGFVFGPGVGGILYNLSRDVLLLPVPDVFRFPYFIAAIIALPPVFLTYFVLRETVQVKTSDLPDSKIQSHTPMIEEYDDNDLELNPKRAKMIKVLYVMSLANGLAMGLGQPLFQLFLMSHITSDIGMIGLIISGAGGIGMLFSVPAGRYADKSGRKGLAVWGAVAGRVSLAALPLTQDLAQTSIVWTGQSASMAISQPAMRAIQADLVPWKLRGKLFGTIQAFFNAGATVGPLAGGAFYAAFSLLTINFGLFSIGGYILPFWIASLVGMIGAFLVWKYIEETKPQVQSPESKP